MRLSWPGCCLLILFSTVRLALVQQTAYSQQQPAEGELKFFEEKIRPVLVKHCYSCHSHEALNGKKLQAELFLDSEAGMLTGGESGPAIVKGKSAESLLIKALKWDGFEMPPTGKLPAEVVA